MDEKQFKPGLILTGDIFPEPVRVIASRAIGADRIKIEAVSTQTQRFYNQVLPARK
jgi:hypothetical protein